MASPVTPVTVLSNSGSSLSVERLQNSYTREPVEALLLSLKNVNSSSNFKELYNRLSQYLPQFTEKQFEALTKTDQLTQIKLIQRLLELTPTLWEEQHELAIKLASWILSGAYQKKTFSERYPFFLQAMDYYSKAIRISNLKQPHLSKNDHLLASELLIECIKVLLVEGDAFKEDLDRLKRQDKPLLTIQAFNRIEDLKRLCCTDEHKGIIQSLYQQAGCIFTRSNIPAFEACAKKAEDESSIEPYQFPLSEQYPTEKYHARLKQIRSNFESIKRISDVKGVRLFQSELTDEVVKFFKVLLEDVIAILGPPPCLYDLRAMGSLSKEEFCPFSDLEYMILIHDTSKGDYFLLLAQIFELQIRSFGETSMDTPIFTCIDLQNPSGMHIDTGGNPANYPHLIQRPDEMANIHKKNIVDPTTINNTSLHSLRLHSNDSEDTLFNTYQKCLYKILLDPGEKLQLRHKEKALDVFSIRLADFLREWVIPFHKQHENLEIKKQYIIPLYILGDIALYFMISG